MADLFNDHIISGQFDLADRFEYKSEVLSKLSVVSKEFEAVVWKRLEDQNFIGKYELRSGNFKRFEEISFADNYDIVSRKLKQLKETTGKVLLIWNSGSNPIVTDTATFVDNWDDFYYPSSDDLFAISETWDWIVYLAHYERLYLGQGIISS